MKPATYQKCAGSYGNLLHSPGEVDWQIKDTLQLLFHWSDKLWTKLTFDDSWMDNVVSKPKLKVFLPLV